jgi:hypothetical protein
MLAQSWKREASAAAPKKPLLPKQRRGYFGQIEALKNANR